MSKQLITATPQNNSSKSTTSEYLIFAPFIACLLLFFACASCSTNNQTRIAIEEPLVTAKDLKISSTNLADKKKQFFDFMRPIIQQENDKVLALRKQLIIARIYNSNSDLVQNAAKEYKVDWSDKQRNWEQLLERVDAVSLNVALAQSANESAWGQSRFAQQGNNFFGQWCYKKGCGIIPKNRNARLTHEVASYKSVNESVRSYIKNINTTRAYAPLRKIRKENRDSKKPANAEDQATGLVLYSQRRDAYVKEIIQMIKSNEKLMQGQG